MRFLFSPKMLCVKRFLKIRMEDFFLKNDVETEQYNHHLGDDDL